MKRKKQYWNLVFFLSIVLSCAVSAEEADFSSAFRCVEPEKQLSTEQLAAVIDGVQRSYAATPAFLSNFTQRSYLAALDVLEVSNGKLWFSKPGKMKWLYEQPEEKLFILRDNRYTLLDYREKQALNATFDQIFLSELPVAFLFGMGNLKESFSVVQGCTADDGVALKLKPKNSSVQKEPSPDSESATPDQIDTLELLVPEKGGLPKAARLVDLAANENSFFFSSQKVLPALSDEDFRVVIPAGFDIQTLGANPE